MLRKASDAELVAWAMTEYQKCEEDVVEAPRATYMDLPGTAVSAEQARRASLIRGASVLRNALSQITDVATTLAGLDAHIVETGMLRTIARQLADIAETIEPRRGNERT